MMKQRAGVLILAIVSSLLQPNLISTAAEQSCFQTCMDRSEPISGMTYQHKSELCGIRCKGAPDPSNYGAIAYSRKEKLWVSPTTKVTRRRPKNWRSRTAPNKAGRVA